MNILFFDTETNGLPLRRNALTTDVENWPRIVQIAWQLWEVTPTDARQLGQASYIIRPEESLIWNNESAAIHKITKERALTEGVPGDAVLAQFRAVASNAKVLIAHNLAFDKPVLKAEFYRLNLNEQFLWWPPAEYCTMENTTALCKLPSKYARPHDPYKFPRLSELHTFLFGLVDGAFDFHNAAGDVECLVQCFNELLRRRLVPVAAQWFRNFRVADAAAVGNTAASTSTASSAC